MNEREIERQLIEYLQQTLARGQTVAPDTPLLASGMLDSMALTHVVAFIERSFGVSVPDDALVAANFRTPALVAKLVSGLRVAAA